MPDKIKDGITMLSAYVDSIKMLADGSWKATLQFLELPPDKLMALAQLARKTGVIAFKPSKFTNSDNLILESVDTKVDGGKSQSKRIRGCLFVLWKQNNEGYNSFENYYRAKTESIINELKSKMDEN